MANVIFNKVIAKDGKTARERYAEMVKQDGVFYLVEDDLYLKDVLLSANIASEIGVEDVAAHFEGSTVEEVLAELAEMAAAKKVWFTDDSAGQSDYAKVYKLWQGANAPDAETAPATLLGTINIPKDKVIQSGSIVVIYFDDTDNTLHESSISGPDVTELIVGPGGTATEADAGKYLKLVLQNVPDAVYISVKDFGGAYTGGTTPEATVNIDGSNVITVTIGKVDAQKVIYQQATPEEYVRVEAGATFDAGTDYYIYDIATETYTADPTVDASNFDDKVAAGLFIKNEAVPEVSVKEKVQDLETKVGGATFDGTQAEWDILPDSEKAKYTYVNIIGDYEPGIPVMTGATADEDGTSGLTPIPHAGDQDKYFKGDGTWATVDTASAAGIERTLAHYGLKNLVDYDVVKSNWDFDIDSWINGNGETVFLVYEPPVLGVLADNPTADESYDLSLLYKVEPENTSIMKRYSNSLEPGNFIFSAINVDENCYFSICYLNESKEIVEHIDVTDTADYPFTVEADSQEYKFVYLRLVIKAGTLTDRYVVSMIRDAEIVDATYSPSISRLDQLEYNFDVFSKNQVQGQNNEHLALSNVYGASNLLSRPYVDDSTITRNGVTFIVNSDGTFTLNGTADADTRFVLTEEFSEQLIALWDGKFYITQNIPLYVCDGGYGSSKSYLFIERYDRGDNEKIITTEDGGYGTCKINLNLPGIKLRVGYDIKAGETFENLSIKPVISYYKLEVNLYQPYAKTNKQLTKEAGELADLTTDDKTNLVSAINEIRASASTAYRPSGSATLATLPPLTSANLGRVYHMTEDFYTTSDFVEGEGIFVAEHNGVGIIETDTGVYQYTVFGAFLDLNSIVGELENLTTIDKSTTVNAINEVDAHTKATDKIIGNWENSDFSDTDVVHELNNVIQGIQNVNKDLGSINTLTTTDKTSAVNAINEVNEKLTTTDTAIDDVHDIIGDWEHSSYHEGNIVTVFNGVHSVVGQVQDNIGDLENLTTEDKTDLVSAINEVDGHADSNTDNIGDMTQLETTAKSNLVSAINEIKSSINTDTSAIGNLATLTTDAKDNLVAAVNEVDAHTDTNTNSIGDITQLETTAKNNLVAAVNEVKSSIATDSDAIGNLLNLTTDVKTDLVSAINEVDTHADTNASNIGDMTQLDTVAKDSLVGAINEVKSGITTDSTAIGVLTDLTTEAKDNLVNAINEVDAHIDATSETIGDWDGTFSGADITSVVADIGSSIETVGDLDELTTDVKSDLVSAINEVDAHTDANTSAIGDWEHGSYSSSNVTSTLESMNGSFNQLTGRIGENSNLTTDEKTTLVGAINEVDAHTDTNTSTIGDFYNNQIVIDQGIQDVSDLVTKTYTRFVDIYGITGQLTNLTTEDQSNLVNAINEVNGRVASTYRPSGNATLATLPPLIASNLGKVYNMTEDFVTTSDFAEGAGVSVLAGTEVAVISFNGAYKYTILGALINIDAVVGDLTNLDTTDKSNVVAAINEVYSMASDKTSVYFSIDGKHATMHVV